jgi:hypothetical protein
MKPMSDKTAQWFEEQYKSWRNGQDRRSGTLTGFSKHLEISRGTLNNWMLKKQTPEDEWAQKLYPKLGPEIYDVLGLPRPDPQLQYILQNWGKLSEDQRQQIYTIAVADLAGLTRSTVAQPQPRRKVRAGKRDTASKP